MKLSFIHNNQIITYYAIYKHVANMTIHISETGIIEVTVPMGIPVYKMMYQVQEKGNWIIDKLNEITTKKVDKSELLEA